MKLDLRPVHGLHRSDAAILEEINTILQRGAARFAEAVAQAARKYMQISEESREKLRGSEDKSRAELADALERVAAKEMHPALALTNALGARQLRRLDYETQSRYVDELIPVAVVNDGKPDILHKSVDDLKREEVAQVFALDGGSVSIRSVEEQRAWQTAKRLSDAAKAKRERSIKLIVREGKWKAENGVFYPLKQRFSLRELETIVAEMKRIL